MRYKRLLVSLVDLLVKLEQILVSLVISREIGEILVNLVDLLVNGANTREFGRFTRELEQISNSDLLGIDKYS